MTVAARAGRLNLRSGRKNACGAVEQKNWIRRLLFGRRLENEETALRSNKETDHQQRGLHSRKTGLQGSCLSLTSTPRRSVRRFQTGAVTATLKRTNDVLQKPDNLKSYRQRERHYLRYISPCNRSRRTCEIGGYHDRQRQAHGRGSRSALSILGAQRSSMHGMICRPCRR